MAKKATDGTRCKTRVKHTFTTDEFREKTMQKNKLERDAELMEEQRAAESSTAKARIKQINSEVADLRNQLDESGEMRDVDSTVVMDRKKGNKTYFRFCPGQPGHQEKLKVENMTEDDFASLPLPEEPKIKPDPSKVTDIADVEPAPADAEGKE